MADDGIVWEDPPVARWGGHPRAGWWFRQLEPLLEHPGKWARVATSSTDSGGYEAAARLRRRQVAIPAGRWEFTGRKLPDGTGAVYARYLGPEDATDG